MSARLVALALVGCSATPAPPPAVIPSRSAQLGVPVAVASAYTPPAAVPPPRFHVECHAFAATAPPAQYNRKKIYDFAPMILRPLRQGPRTAERPRTGTAPSVRDLRMLFAMNAGDVTACWKSAASRGATATQLEVGVTIDPFGGTHDLSVRSERAADDELVACVQRALTGYAFTMAMTRSIRLGTTLVFERADQPAWPRPLPPPVATTSRDERAGTICTPVVDEGPVPQVRLVAPLLVTDWDQSREPPRRSGIPEVRLGCAMHIIESDKRSVRTALLSNWGAFQDCYADAIARDPALAGDVMLQTGYSRGGAAANPRITGGVGDPALHACLVAALQDTWVAIGPSEDGTLEVNLTLTLAPPVSPPPPADDPAALLDAGDAEGALAAWTAKLATPVSHSLGCRARAGVVLAIAKLVPWLADPRLAAAIADLANAAGALPPEAARTCVDEVAPLITELTRVRGRPVGAWMATYVWLERYAAALPLAPYLTDGVALRWAYAEALLATPRAAEGTEILRKLAWDPKIGGLVADELATRATRPMPIGDTCAD